MTIHKVVEYEFSEFYSHVAENIMKNMIYTGNSVQFIPFWNKSFICPCLTGAKRKHGRLIYQQQALLFVSTMKEGRLYYGQL